MAPFEKSTDSTGDLGVSLKSETLLGKRIALGVCGGIGAVEVVKIIREIRRHSARVTAFMTPSAQAFIGATSLEWACNEPTVSHLSPRLEHFEGFDLVIVAPATLNTISKCVVGLCDNPVTLLVASQLGQKGRLLLVPAMNTSLRSHPRYIEHLTLLEGWGTQIFECPEEEGRFKMPSPEALAEKVIRCLN